MSGKYYSTKNKTLTKTEKEAVKEYLLKNVGVGNKYRHIWQYTRECDSDKIRGGLGDLGIPYWRLIPYLRAVEKELYN